VESTLPLLIGEAPSRGGDRYHMFPLSGPPARVLCTLAGIPPQDEGTTYGKWTWALYERFECENLFERYAEAEPWSVPRARERAALRKPDLTGRVVLLLGRRVQAAFGVEGDFHTWTTVVQAADLRSVAPAPGMCATVEFSVAAIYRVAAIPHPSGLNRALNDPAERERCGATLRQAMELAAA
jgi:hypothetical protein